MASLTSSTIASTYDRLLALPSGGLDSNNLVAITDGDSSTAIGMKVATSKIEIIPASDDANAFEVSQADGTAVFTVNTSSPAFTLTGNATITTADNTDTLKLISTDADASVGPSLNFYRNSGSPADNDNIGILKATGRNDNSQDVDYVLNYNSIGDASDGTEDGRFETYVMLAGTARSRVKMDETETIFNNDSVDLDFRVESDNLTDALFVQGSDGYVGIGISAPKTVLEVGGVGGAHVTLSHTPTNASDIADNDLLGQIDFAGYDTDYSGDFIIGARIRAQVDGSWDASGGGNVADAPTELQFITVNSDTSHGVTHAISLNMVIKSDGKIGMGTDAPAHTLVVKGEAATSPVLNMVNADSEDGDTGRESTIRFSGFRSSDAAVDNAQITGCHDGSGDDNDGMMTFWTNNGTSITEKMRITSEGRIGIGHTNPQHDLCIGDNTSGHVTAMRLSTNTDATSQVLWAIAGVTNKWSMSNSPADQLYIYDYGDSSIASHIDTTDNDWQAGSDLRIKKDINNIGSTLDAINSLRPITWKRKYGKTDKVYPGLVAQEVLPHIPLVVGGSEDSFKEVTVEDNVTYEGGLSIGYGNFVPYLIKAIQELSAKVKALEDAQ